MNAPRIDPAIRAASRAGYEALRDNRDGWPEWSDDMMENTAWPIFAQAAVTAYLVAKDDDE